MMHCVNDLLHGQARHDDLKKQREALQRRLERAQAARTAQEEESAATPATKLIAMVLAQPLPLLPCILSRASMPCPLN